MGNYGREHSGAKRDKLGELSVLACEVTGSMSNLEAHHTVPKFFNGPDMKSNYQILAQDFHQYLHYIVNVSNDQLVLMRKMESKKLWNAPLHEYAQKAKSKIDAIDEILMAQFVDNLINKLAHDVREKVLYLTLLSNMKTIRDLTVENHTLKSQLNHKK